MEAYHHQQRKFDDWIANAQNAETRSLKTVPGPTEPGGNTLEHPLVLSSLQKLVTLLVLLTKEPLLSLVV